MRLFGRTLNISFERLRNGSWINYHQNKLTAKWGNEDALKISLNNPIVSTLINIRADYLSKANIYEVNSQNEPIENSEFNKLITNPNPYQSKEDFLKQLEWYLICFGYVYTRPYGAVGFAPDYLYNLYTPNISFDKEFKKTILNERKEVKELEDYSFKYTDVNTVKTISLKDVVPFYDQANLCSDNPIIAPSRIDSIRKQIETIESLADAGKVSIDTYGREMIYKEKQGNGVSGAVPLPNQDKKDMEDKWQNDYGSGMGRKRTVILNKEMGWKSMHIPTRDLGSKELLELNGNLISQSLQVPNEIYKSFTQGDTFENKKQAEVMFIQNVMQARADNIASSFAQQFGVMIKADYSHLPSMQVIEEQKANKLLKISQAIRNLTQSGFDINAANDYLLDNGLNNLNNG